MNKLKRNDFVCESNVFLFSFGMCDAFGGMEIAGHHTFVTKEEMEEMRETMLTQRHSIT